MFDRIEPSGRPLWVAIGASDSTGEGTTDPERESWVAQLAAAMRGRVGLINLAVGGATVAAARRDQVPAAVAAGPDVVTLWLAVNDAITGVSLADYRADLLAALSDLRRAGIETIVGNLPDLTKIPSVPIPPDGVEDVRAEIRRWNDEIASIARATGAVLVDMFEHEPRRADFSADGFHPSSRGHALIARAFHDPLERTVARRLDGRRVG